MSFLSRFNDGFVFIYLQLFDMLDQLSKIKYQKRPQMMWNIWRDFCKLRFPLYNWIAADVEKQKLDFAKLQIRENAFRP